jgi:lipopolysaccharide/colanic/teichoic acid biosynthesis glycosyltransferase
MATIRLFPRLAVRRRWQLFLVRSGWWWHTRRFDHCKRALDLLLVVPAVVLLAPLLLAAAVAIKLNDRGPALFWQRRVGRDGVEFDLPKFRSMRVDAPRMHVSLAGHNQHGADGVTFKMRHDPRITPVGRWIRRFSVDELPQLWCVLRGEMTLVGPRPPLPSEVARYTPTDRTRLAVKPGLTCIWQVSGRAEIPFERQVTMDIEYIRRRSLRQDFRLLWATLPAVIRGRGAY